MTTPNWPHASNLYTEARRIIDNNGNVYRYAADERTFEAQAEDVHVTGRLFIDTHFPECKCSTLDFPDICERCTREFDLKSLLKNPCEDKP